MPIRTGIRRLPTQPYGSHSFFLRYFHTPPSLLDRGYNGRCMCPSDGRNNMSPSKRVRVKESDSFIRYDCSQLMGLPCRLPAVSYIIMEQRFAYEGLQRQEPSIEERHNGVENNIYF